MNPMLVRGCGCRQGGFPPALRAFHRAGGGAAQARGFHPALRAFSRVGGSAAQARGFTLLEVLVAFSLLAIGLGILLAILSSGVRDVSTAADSTRASLYAQGLFATLGGDGRLQPGRTQGSFENGRYRWTLQISPAPTPALAPPPGSPPGAQVTLDPSTENQLLHVVLVVDWGGGHHALRVETLRAYLPPQAVTP